ncbi:MAG: Holliday junction resolvase RuvX [Candidatus Solibacter usitatus]|nr:Holliday junction resolvase RuvX [Candidatus Solibacter usitatus]
MMALDVGKRRIGLALAGPEAGVPVGLDALRRGTMREDITKLERMARERKVELFLVGLPLHMRGGEGEMAAFVRTFGDRLEAATGIPVRYQDERLTSVEAEARMRESGMSLAGMLKQKRRGAVDEMAAVILLEEYLRAAGAEAE